MNGNGDLKLGNEGRRFSRLMSSPLAGEFCPKIFFFFFKKFHYIKNENIDLYGYIDT